MSCINFTLTCIEKHVEQGATTDFLTMLFGGWVQTFYGDTSVAPSMSPVMVMIGGLNFLALLYGTINVTYNSAHIMMNAASTGHIFGKMSPYVPLRIAIALGSLAPMVTTASGGSFVSVGQVTGMYVIVHGAGAADLFWRAGVNQYISLTNSSQTKPLAKDVFNAGETLTSMLLCNEYFGERKPSEKFSVITQKASGAELRFSSPTLPTISSIRGFYVAHTPSNPDELVADHMSSNTVTRVTLQFSKGVCGSIDLPMVPRSTNSSMPVDKAAYYANYYGIDAILRYIADIQTQVANLKETIDRADISKYVSAYAKFNVDHYYRYITTQLQHKEIAKKIYQSHINLSYCHSRVVKRAFAGEFNRGWEGQERNYCSSASGSVGIPINVDNNLLNQLTKGGWLKAASSISRMNGMMQIANSQAEFSINNLISFRLPSRTEFCEDTSWWTTFSLGERDLDDEIDEAEECRSFFASEQTPPFLWSLLRSLALSGEIGSDWATAQKSSDWQSMLTLSERQANSSSPVSSNGPGIIRVSSSILAATLELGNHTHNIASGLSNPSSLGIDYDTALYDISGETNALTMLATLGEGLKVIYWIVLTAMSGAQQVSDSMASSTVTGFLGTPVKVLANTLFPLVIASISGAFILANVLPMLPVITFIFIVTAFFLICAEALGGIALGSALLASAAGEGLMAIHGLRMAALYGAIFLRPSLHTIGLMLGFALCNVSYAIFNVLWWSSIGNNANTSWDIMDMVMITGGFPMVMFGLMVYCLKAPNLYANNLMTWVATEAVGQFGDGHEYIDSTKTTMGKMQGAFDTAVAGAGRNSAAQPSPPEPKKPSDDKVTKTDPPPKST
ncbi:DotA/TraY family protein [Vibrio chagasii]|uniref:DotA/TraY family protein n=1 Tax=Vibrio chagasii TaxID=170679 RepID=A0A7V7TIF3_9VIBR|nr:DotA/TraY family protein [Vibrio chagasii]KAB0482471.1 DotA/TraY family protein [Vibrio chagasii]